MRITRQIVQRLADGAPPDPRHGDYAEQMQELAESWLARDVATTAFIAAAEEAIAAAPPDNSEKRLAYRAAFSALHLALGLKGTA